MADTSKTDEPVTDSLKHEGAESNTSGPQKLELGAEFSSFLELRNAIEKYQKENCVQLIVKDSKLLKAESTRKIIPKVYHLVNHTLMYHSITYCCKFHGELKQKPGTRVKKVGQKRLNCPVYIRFKLSGDFQRLVLFDIEEKHNHDIDRTTFQIAPRQQVYNLQTMMRCGTSVKEEVNETDRNVNGLPENTKKHDADYTPPRKSARIQARRERRAHKRTHKQQSDNDGNNSDSNSLHIHQCCKTDSPLDSEFSGSDSDEEEIFRNRALLPFPIRLIGSAIQSSPELLAATKQLIQIQMSKLLIEKQKLILETKQLELMNSKLELELRALEKNLTTDTTASSEGRDTTIYLQTT